MERPPAAAATMSARIGDRAPNPARGGSRGHVDSPTPAAPHEYDAGRGTICSAQSIDADRRSAEGGVRRDAASDDPQWMFVDLLLDDAQTALLLDASGFVLGGIYIDADGDDVSQEVGARLSGISDEVVRAAHHLDLGEWRSMTFETEIAVVAMAPAADNSLIVVAASRATPLGLIRRLLDRCLGARRNGLAGRTPDPRTGTAAGMGRS